MRKSNRTNPFTILRITIESVISNPIIFYPMCILAFIQLLCLELIYFTPRFPLSVFGAPVIRYFWGDVYLHYPFNFVLLPKIFHWVQIFIYIFAAGLLSGLTVAIIETINSSRKISLKQLFKQTFGKYFHIVLASFLSWALMFSLAKVHGLILKRALLIRSETGFYAILKKMVVVSAPYVQLFIGILVTTLLAFVIPILIIERDKIIGAIKRNFISLRDSFFLVLALVLIPTLVYLPIFIIRNVVIPGAQMAFPEVHALMIVVSVIIAVLIDTVTLTAITTYYLAKKENT